MANESNKELTSVWTPANIVTCVRIVFIPVFMIVSALSHASVAGTDWSTFDGPLAAAAFILYVILSCTDKVDGYLARSRNEITDFGKFLDPIADKLLVFSALLLFLDFGAVTVWSVFIILFRELLVSALAVQRSMIDFCTAPRLLPPISSASTRRQPRWSPSAAICASLRWPAFSWGRCRCCSVSMASHASCTLLPLS